MLTREQLSIVEEALEEALQDQETLKLIMSRRSKEQEDYIAAHIEKTRRALSLLRQGKEDHFAGVGKPMDGEEGQGDAAEDSGPGQSGVPSSLRSDPLSAAPNVPIAPAPQAKKCPNLVDGQCPLHNLHCQYPYCEMPVQAPSHNSDKPAKP